MDAPDIDTWVNAQTPAIYQQMQEIRSDNDRPGALSEDTSRIVAGPRRSGAHKRSNAQNATNDSDSSASNGAPDNALMPDAPESRANNSANTTVAEQFDNGQLRLEAIYEAAVSFSSQTALAWRYDQLREMTKHHEGALDVITSFAPFVQDDHMLLPSVTRVEDRFDLSRDRKELRATSVQYQIAEEPRAVSQPPTWRQYIWREFPYPEKPHPALRPQNEREIKIWENGIEDGWQSGLIQAQRDWENNLNKLVRDIRGRITYRILESRGIVQEPKMQGGLPRLTSADNGRTINAGEVIHSITVPLSFKDQSEWGGLWLPANASTPEFESLDTDTIIADDQPEFTKDPQ